MRIQSSTPNTLGYFALGKTEVKNESISDLFLNKDDKEANGKPRFEVRMEGGYIRKYIVKANGDKVLIMETKQKENPDGIVENESGDLVDMARTMLMEQLERKDAHSTMEDRNRSAWEKENSIVKYQTGI